MRGEILYYDAERGAGFISGADGNRYHFAAEDLIRPGRAEKGRRIEFDAEGNRARRVSYLDQARTATTVPEITPGAGPLATAESGQVAAYEPPARSGLFGSFWKATTAGYARFRGRSPRREFWGFVLFSFLFIILAGFAGAMIDMALGNIDREEPVVAVTLAAIAGLAFFLPSLAVTVRRLHDIGLSGWFILLGFIPSVGNLIIIVFALIPSQGHENRWGPAPI